MEAETKDRELSAKEKLEKAEKELQAECWGKIQTLLDEYSCRFTCQLTVNEQGFNFGVGLTKKQ
jgi:hypothetical protein